jgi:single-strand DNA-binding protein
MSVNKTILIGFCGAEPETQALPSGTPLTTVSLATSYKPKEGEEKTEWHRLKFFGRMAEVAGAYLHKGSHVYIEGRGETETWEHREHGIRMERHCVVVYNMEMLNKIDREETVDTTLAPHPSVRQAVDAASEARVDYDDDIPF